MDLKIAFKHLECTPAIKEQIGYKLGRLDRLTLLTHPQVSWVTSPGRDEHKEEYYTEVTIKDREHTYHAKAHDENMYKSFDLVVDKLERQLMKVKTKIKNKIHSREEKATYAEGDYSDTEIYHKNAI